MPRPLAALLLLACAATHARAQALLFDFGTTPATGQVTVNATAAPSLGGPAGLTGNLVYNVFSGTDSNQNVTAPTSYQYADGSAAPALSFTFRSGTSWSSLSTATPFTRVGVSGGRSGVGVFATPGAPNNTNLFTDFISASNSNSTTDYLSLEIGGLAPGDYDIFVVSNQTYNQTAGDNSRTVRAGVGSAGLSDLSSLGTVNTLSYNYTNIVADTATWADAEGKYWTSFRLTIGSTATTNTLYLGGFRSGDQQGGVFNAIQIVAVPEPATFSALAGLGALGIASLRRRRRTA
jgi:hypothetical protein